MNVPFKVKIESRLCILRFRQFSRNITQRWGITEIIKSAYSRRSSVLRISLWGKERAAQSEDVQGRSLFTKFTCRTERMNLPFICIPIFQPGKRSDVITQMKPREAVRKVDPSDCDTIKSYSSRELWPFSMNDDWLWMKKKTLLLRESRFSKTRSFIVIPCDSKECSRLYSASSL